MSKQDLGAATISETLKKSSSIDEITASKESRDFLRESMAESAVRALNTLLVLIENGHLVMSDKQHFPAYLRALLEGSTAIKLHDKLKTLDNEANGKH